jgi:hypothetical protein
LGEGKEIAVKRIYFTIGFIVRGQKEREGFFCQCGDFRADIGQRRVIRGYDGEIKGGKLNHCSDTGSIYFIILAAVPIPATDRFRP